jgi:hypothetical protein
MIGRATNSKNYEAAARRGNYRVGRRGEVTKQCNAKLLTVMLSSAAVELSEKNMLP